MLNWHLWVGSDSEWDQTLFCAEDYTVFQSFAWGELKQQSNWIPVRYVGYDKNGKVLGLAQLLVKKLPLGITFIWVPGGPVSYFPNHNYGDFTELLHGLVTKVQKDYRHSVIRFHVQAETNSNYSYQFNKACLRPFFKINSGYSVLFKIDQTFEHNKQKMTAKHRYYTKKAISARIYWEVGNSDKQLADLSVIHQEMVREKQISSIATSYEELERMRNILGDKILIITGYLNNIPITSCLVLIFGSKAFYMVAATGKQGRDVSAAYAMFDRLMLELTQRNIHYFDFGGIDPVSKKAAGVNHYKCGFGGQIIEQLGEWEAASSELIRLAVNIAIRSRGGRV